MDINTLHRALDSLATSRNAFWSEADFQFALAWELKTLIPTAEIHLERRDAVHKYYVDIWVEENGSVFPIELKYKTKAASVGGVVLLNQSAVDFGCFDYLWDIHRLEDLVASYSDDGHVRGFAVMLTNDSAYYGNSGRLSAYDDFKIYDGATRGGGVLSWKNTAKGKPFVHGSREPFELKGVYKMQWHLYNKGKDGFRYLVNEVK